MNNTPWIPVSAPPPDDQIVVCRNAEGTLAFCWVHQGVWALFNPTHWFPLPEAVDFNLPTSSLPATPNWKDGYLTGWNAAMDTIKFHFPDESGMTGLTKWYRNVANTVSFLRRLAKP